MATPPAFGNQLRAGQRPVVLAIDMMRAYFDPANSFYLPPSAVLDASSAVIDAARGSGVPVVHTRVEYGPGGTGGGLFANKIPALRQFSPGSTSGEIVDEVRPHGDEVVLVKEYASAFFGTTLASHLATAGCDTVVIVGVSTSGCVRATVVDAISSGVVPIVVREGVADRAVGPHEAALSDIAAKYGEVFGVADALRYLEGVRS